LPAPTLPDREAVEYIFEMAATASLMRWPDAAPLLGVDTREVLDLIVASELEPFRRHDDLYVRREEVERLSARSIYGSPLTETRGREAVRPTPR
jgi:hypothetical protein